MKDATSGHTGDGGFMGDGSSPAHDLVSFPDRSQDMESIFSVRYEERNGVRHLAVIGEVDLAVKEELDLALDAPRLMVDLTGVTFMDSTGLGCLLEAKARLRDEMRISGLSPRVERLFEIAGIDGEFDEHR